MSSQPPMGGHYRSFLKMILINELVGEICRHLPGNHMHCTDGCTDVHNLFSSYKEIDINTKPIQFFLCTYSNKKIFMTV